MTAPEPDPPRLYLVTPPAFELSAFPGLLARALDAADAACVRLDLPRAGEDEIRRAADTLRPVCHDRDVAVVIAEHFRLAAELGLDGAHVDHGRVSVREARRALGPDRILGVHAGASRHAGMTAAEAGADYVSFGPVAAGGLGDGRSAEDDLFAWWAEMVETPVVAEGGVAPADAARLAPYADFIVPDPALWSAADPIARLAEYVAALREPA